MRTERERGPEAGRILVIDDSEVILERVKTCLKGAGYEVATSTQTVGNGRHLSNCDLVIIDFHMPGINGDFVVASLRRALPPGPVRCLFYLYTSDAAAARNYAAQGFDGALNFKGDERALLPQINAIFRLIRTRALSARLRADAPR